MYKFTFFSKIISHFLTTWLEVVMQSGSGHTQYAKHSNFTNTLPKSSIT